MEPATEPVPRPIEPLLLHQYHNRSPQHGGRMADSVAAKSGDSQYGQPDRWLG